MTTVTLIDLTRRFGGAVAVDHLSLEVQSGELVALLGPSGCGKTTTLRMIAGLLAPSAGDIRFDGNSVLRTPPEKRGAVMVFQKHLLFPHLSVVDNVAFGLKMRRVSRPEIERRTQAMLERVQLGGFGARRSHELSSGQQQRVALARALVTAPAVLLLDEPLANLDVNLRMEMRRLIRELQQESGITTIIVTHDQEEAVTLADRVALLANGALLQYETPRSLYERPASLEVARFFRNENFLYGEKRADTFVTTFGATLRHTCSHLADGPAVATVRPEQSRLVNADAEDALPATVRSVVYMGVATHVDLSLPDGAAWTVVAPSECTLEVGARIGLRLDPPAVWLMQPSAECASRSLQFSEIVERRKEKN